MIALNPQGDYNIFKDVNKLRRQIVALRAKSILLFLVRIFIIRRKSKKQLKSLIRRLESIFIDMKAIEDHRISTEFYEEIRENLREIKEWNFEEFVRLVKDKSLMELYVKLVRLSYEMEKIARVKYYTSKRKTQATS